MTAGSTLTGLAPDLYTAEDSARLPGGFVMPLRMTVIRLPDKSLVVHSPVRATDALVQAVADLGPVGHLVAPNRGHHLYMGPWQKRFPLAQLHAARGIGKKRPDLRVDSELGGDSVLPASWSNTVDQLFVRGANKLEETVFLHRPSQTLVVTDLFFHILRPASFASKVVFSLMGTNGRFRMSRLMRLLVHDRRAFAASVQDILTWDFRRVLPAHGEVLDAPDAPAIARAGSTWALAI